MNNVLITSIQTGNYWDAEFALRRGASPSTQAADGRSVLELAVYNNHYQIAELLIHHKADVNAANGPRQRTPLHVAQTAQMVALLILNNAEINKRDISGTTPLLAACLQFTKRSTVIEALLNHNADPFINNDEDVGPPSDLIEMIGVESVTAAFNTYLQLQQPNSMGIQTPRAPTTPPIDKGPPATFPLHEASKKRIDLTPYIEEAGCVNIQDDDGNTPLHYAARSLNRSAVELLLNHGAFGYIENNEGNTPVHLLFEGSVGHPADAYEVASLAALFTQKRAHFDLVNLKGATPLMYACIAGNLAAVRIFVEAGASLNPPNNDQLTPLKIARCFNLPEIAAFLRSCGATETVTDGQ